MRSSRERIFLWVLYKYGMDEKVENARFRQSRPHTKLPLFVFRFRYFENKKYLFKNPSRYFVSIRDNYYFLA